MRILAQPRPGDATDTASPGVDSLLAEAERCVAASLARRRSARGTAAPAELLGRILLARLDATRRADDPAAATEASRLAVAEQSLRAVLDQWQGRRSLALEWVIIWLIALDILVALF